MTITSGFFNGINHDRKFNAGQMSSIFNGIINDGVFQSIGTALMVNATTGMNISVGIGRAWFNSTWTYNDAILPLTVAQSESILNRIDAVVLEVNNDTAVRDNSIKIIKGTPGTSPVAPTMVSTTNVHQYPLAHIYVGAAVSTITQANITNKVGTTSCPFVTGILQTMTIDAIVAQWQTQFSEWNDTNRTAFLNWIDLQETDFTSWLDYIKTLFGDDPAGNIQNEINNLKMSIPVTTSGSGSAFVATIPNLTLSDGSTIRLKIHADIQSGATLNVNDLGAHAIYTAKGLAVKPGIVAGSYITVIYNGTSFILQGEGGDLPSTSTRFGNDKNQQSILQMMLSGRVNLEDHF